jgi:hypothetical protein
LAKASSFSTKSYTSDTNTTVTTVPNQLAGGLSWYGAGSSLSMSAYQANDATSTTGDASISTDPLFPFAFAGPPVNYTNNYQLWTGQCRGEQPPSAFTTNAVSVSPGTTQSIPVWEPAVILKVTYAGSRVAPGDVHMTYSSTSPSCTDEWIETIRGTAPNYTLATTSKLGVLAYTGVPYASSSTSGTTASASGIAGTETFCADYYTGSTYGWRQASASPASLSMTTPTAVTINITSSSTAGQCP